MYYSAVGLLAILILLIENHDILLGSGGEFKTPAWRNYRRFLYAVLAYYVTDVLWGFLESRKLSVPLFADTTVYFIAMGVGVLFWAQFTVALLENGQSGFGRFLVAAGRVVAGGIALLAVVNLFAPVMFTVDEACVYRALPLRHVMLVCQILLLLLISAYAFSELRRRGSARATYATLALFGLIMALFLSIQLRFPYLPLYAAAYLLGVSLLHTFVVNDEKEKYRRGLAQAEETRDLKDTIASLLDHMPGMTFSKDAQTGEYLACNLAFAQYANKRSPEEVVGLTDAQLFDAGTAAQFAEDDKLALSMDAPFVYFEDVPDAAGRRRQFQTTRLKYRSFSGQLCVLGMSQDITDQVRVRRESAVSKDAYERARGTGLIFTHIAQALARGYEQLFYVDVDSEKYIEYRHDVGSGTLVETRRGWHFFEACRIEAEYLVHPDDRAAVVAALARKTLTAELDRSGSCVLTYRLLTEDGARYVSLRVSRMVDDAKCIILGVTDMDEQMRQRRAMLQAEEEKTAYARLNALAGDYLCAYVVDPETCEYREISASRDYADFGQARAGTDFFEVIREAARSYNHPDDLSRFLSAFTRENVMAEIARSGSFTLSYRLVRGGAPLYVQLKAAPVREKEGERLVVGITDIDALVRQEETYVRNVTRARMTASVDPLTGIKNRHAYLEAEERLNAQIAEGSAPDFAVVLLDVNDLKKMNDSVGHQAGDRLLRDACKIICDTFEHSPVFRIGGDEFAVLSQGGDFQRIDALVEQMAEHNAAALGGGGVVIACGMAKYAGEDCVAPVFERADQRMYENKSELKARRHG